MHARFSGKSSNRHVTATSSGNGDLVGLDYDERWLESAHSFNIGRETTEASRCGAVRRARVTRDSQRPPADHRGPVVSRDPGLLAGHIVSQYKLIGNVMPNFTKPLQEGLDKVATAINKFVGALIAAAIPVVALIIAGIAACIGIISAPPGIGAIAVGVVVAAGAAYVGYTMLQGDCEDVQNSWNQAVSNWSGYDGEHWPKAAF